jgi:predicted GIY-YIG superfamily endonuclease
MGTLFNEGISRMTIGIYILKFEGTNKVYIGQSVNIEGRYISHKTSLKCGNSPKKLQEAYNVFGTPSMEILVECTKDELNINEEEAIGIFNSANDGFNTMKSYGYSSELFGENCGNSKYTNEEVYKVFIYLIEHQELTHKDIMEKTGVSRGVISDISMCDGHKWLKEAFPDKYKTLEYLHENRRKLRRTAASRGIEYPEVMSPEGNKYKIDSVRGFAREHGLNPNAFGRVLRGQNNSHKGWRLA